MGNYIRRNGDTTRMLDEYVQEFFTKGRVQIIDHKDLEPAHKNTFSRFMDRMLREHGIGEDIKNGKIKVNKLKRTVEIIDKDLLSFFISVNK